MSLAVALLPPRWRARIPALPLALAVGTALHHGLAQGLCQGAVGPLMGTLVYRWASGPITARLMDPRVWQLVQEAWWPLLQFAAALALTSGLQTLLAASAVDVQPGAARDGNARLRTHGLANLVTGVLGLLPVAGSLSSTAVNVQAGGSGTASRLVHAAALLLALTVGVVVLRHVPMAAIAGVFVAVAWGLVDRWSRAVFGQALRRPHLPGDWRAALAGPVAIMGLVMGVTIGISMLAGIAAGILAAVLSFVRSHIKPPVRRCYTANTHGSRKLRPPRAATLLQAQGPRIVVVELQGGLFFGTADETVRALEQASQDAHTLIIDLSGVREVDATGARALVRFAAGWRGTERQPWLAGVAPDDERGRQIRHLDVTGALPPRAWHPDADRALEAAEDELLARAGLPVASPAPMPLAETLVGQGLTPDELAILQAHLRLQRVARGQAVFHRGDDGDALYILLQGQVAIVLPASGPGAGARRLVSFAPGVVFGEIGLLRQQPRSADARVEEDALLAVLDRAGYERLTQQHPVLHGRMLRNIALHLSDRLGALTREFDALASAASPVVATGWAGVSR